MTDFMRDHISAGKLSRCVQLSLHILVKAEIDVHLFVPRTIKRTHRRIAEAARRFGAAVVEDQRRLAIFFAHLSEQIAPDGFGVVKDYSRKFGQAFLGWIFLAYRIGLLLLL